MLATGNSSVAAITRSPKLKEAMDLSYQWYKNGQLIKDIRLLSLLAAPEGVACMKEAHPDERAGFASRLHRFPRRMSQ